VINKWRPEGWDKTVNQIIWSNSYGHGEYNAEGIVNDTADAMLDALLKEGIPSGDRDTCYITVRYPIIGNDEIHRGKWVFIEVKDV
jgi:hypothetical protein